MCGRASEHATIHLYYAEISSIDQEAVDAFVAIEDLENLRATTRPRRRREHLAGRALMRFALQDWTGRPARSQRLRLTAGGKPECVDGPAVNVAHSGNLVACALSPAGRIGVDVQFPVLGRQAQVIAHQYFSPAETDWLGSQPGDRFYMLWVLKEAYLKALGLGLAGGLDALQCKVEPPVIESATAHNSEVVTLALYSAGDGFIALATNDFRFDGVHIHCWNPGAAATERSSSIRLIARTA